MTDLRALSGVRYRGRGGHVESWFVQARDPSGRRAVWIRHVVFAQAAPEDTRREAVPPVAEVWAVAFDRDAGHVAVKCTVPFDRARFSERALDVEVDGCALDPRRAKGRAASGGRAVAWELAIGDGRVAPVVHYPRALYEARWPSSKLVTPVADAGCTGTVRVVRGPGEAEEVWDLTGWSAVVGHNWGSGQPELYAWAHASAWDVPDLVVEAVAGRVRLGRLPLLSPVLAAAFVRFRGERFDFGAFEGFARNRAVISTRRLDFEAEGRGVSLRFEAFAETDELVGLHYPDPAGEVRSVLASAVARARLELRLPGARVVTANARSASIEIGTRESDALGATGTERAERHGVRMYV